MSTDAASNPETARYWAEAANGRLFIKSCRRCGQPHHYPRAFCPHCFHPETEWVEASGEGEIHSFSVMRRADPVYVVAYVALREGVTMLTNIVGTDPDAIRIGAAVRVDFAERDGRMVPVFRLDGGEAR